MKDKIEIYINYKDERERLEKYRKVCTINRHDVISAISNFDRYESKFIRRAEEMLK